MSNLQPGQLLQIVFSVYDCRIRKFALSAYGTQNQQPPGKEEYEFGLALTLDLQPDKKIVGVVIKSTLSDARGDKPLLAELESVHEFLVMNYQELLIKIEGGEAFPEQMIIQFFAIAISNTRGLYVAKLEGTPYANAVLPVVDVSRLMPKQVSIS